MRVVLAIAAALSLSPAFCRAQDGRDMKREPDEAYTARLVRLVEGLQKNPWRGWKAGTVVVVRYLGDEDPAAKPPARVEPDIIYKVLEADKLLERTQELKGKSFRHEFFVKDERGLAEASAWGKDKVGADFEIDGLMLDAILTELRMEEFPGGMWVAKEWSLAGYPSILLRRETNGEGWRITSAKASKKIGAREFECVEIKRRMRFYSDGPMEVMTTQYLSPEVPGHLVEQVEEFFRVGEKGVLIPSMVVHQKVLEIKIQ